MGGCASKTREYYELSIFLARAGALMSHVKKSFLLVVAGAHGSDTITVYDGTKLYTARIFPINAHLDLFASRFGPFLCATVPWH